MIQQGQPLYRIAGLDTLILRAYVTGSQLAQFRLGQQVQVSVDGGSGLRAIPGTVQWISDKAEFTPTPVQTRDDRATLVYAIKVAVPNEEGALKIGMPGDVTLPPANTAQVP
jgi:HlyD family secretion protein